MVIPPADGNDTGGQETASVRPVRADAQRNIDALLEAALAVFSVSGVDAPVREIAAKAGVGIGTLYRHFPQRSDLIVAVFRQQVDATANAAAALAAQHTPGDALALWMQRYADFIATKHGLAAALHSGNPAYNNLPAYFDAHLRPALHTLVAAAISAGEVRGDINADDILQGVRGLCMSTPDSASARRMVALLADGLRYAAGNNGNAS